MSNWERSVLNDFERIKNARENIEKIYSEIKKILEVYSTYQSAISSQNENNGYGPFTLAMEIRLLNYPQGSPFKDTPILVSLKGERIKELKKFLVSPLIEELKSAIKYHDELVDVHREYFINHFKKEESGMRYCKPLLELLDE